ncbi:glycosyltransferase family 39 protein [Haloarcula sp. S1CR25-12]|uniref:Glycosyltransferase family 39 protein n=1 Tax=Haloarcula saliterrae TaxID=2950534 RepID=A0ABU2FA92_9EURY|nr:glycosyltransferase family 39 protein [Haloarcula sp. S1CR25-12]MDS0258635.1 glycosyltransferase family 39 protein [Haloarcula sp. S1CR25-12]
MNRLRQPRTQAAVVAVMGGLVVYALAHVVFPYHTSNHDEAVYLQQAAMLLEGQLFLRPPVDGPFRPWFFVESGRGLYSKYTPPTAAMFAVGKLLGGYRVALGLVAAGALAGTYHTVREAFDARTGVVASALMFASPLFLLEASVFLSYVPTMFWNLVFAASYLHADRTGSRKTAALSGLAVGIAFFARPYTAVLFATPFILHALWSLRELHRPAVERLGLTAALGLVGVAATLGYNAVVTGDPFLFPYQAFAPLDGLGFGRREIAGYSRTFTPSLSLRANAEVLWVYATEWVVAGPLGTLAALVGVWTVRQRGFDDRQLALAGVGLTIPLGNVLFWGNLNILGELSDPSDGLIAFFGPYYHTDLLVPTVAFGAVGLLAAVEWSREAVPRRLPDDRARPALAALLLVAATVGGGSAVAAVGSPVAENYDVTQQYEQAYEPFEGRALDDSVVFLPRTYGDWLNHPFQLLRNDPGYDGQTVYAMQRQQFAVVDSYPDRTYYRYVFRGEWAPFLDRPVEPRLQPVTVASGDSVTTDISATVPESAESVTVRLTNGTANTSSSNYTTVGDPTELSLGLRTDANRTRLTGDGVDEAVSVPTPRRGTVTVVAFVDFGADRAVKYRWELPVTETATGVRALTPRLEVCWSERFCGGKAAYVPGTHRDGVQLNATVETTG